MAPMSVNEPLATSIALNQQAITLVQGASQTLTATVTPSYASQNVTPYFYNISFQRGL